MNRFSSIRSKKYNDESCEQEGGAGCLGEVEGNEEIFTKLMNDEKNKVFEVVGFGGFPYFLLPHRAPDDLVEKRLTSVESWTLSSLILPVPTSASASQNPFTARWKSAVWCSETAGMGTTSPTPNPGTV